MRPDLFRMLIHRLRRSMVSFLPIAVATLGALAASALVDSSQAGPLAGRVWLDPPSQEVSEGSTGIVDARSEGLTGIHAARLAVSFHPAYLEVVDADANPGNGIQITPGTCPSPDFVAVNTADNTAGTVTYQAWQLAPALPCDGGIIASMEFLCRDMDGTDPITVPITITEVAIADIDGVLLDFTVEHAEIICVPGCTIKGTALPQAHPADASGVSVCVEETGCITTGADGSFQFTVSEDLPHVVTADFVHHLAAETTGLTCGTGETIYIDSLMIRAGDLNEDGVINILDAVMIAGNFGRTEPTDW